MGTFPILPKRAGSDKWCNTLLSNQHLPDFYMNDFSVLGIIVDNVRDAIQVLHSGGVQIRQESDFALAHLHNSAHMKNLVAILEKHGIDFEISDIADQIYQG